jgi:mercuric ion transport protein
MKDETLIRMGIVGAVIAAICCFTPILAIALGAIGLAALAAKADYVLIPVMLAFLVLAGFGLYRRRMAAQASRDTNEDKKVIS